MSFWGKYEIIPSDEQFENNSLTDSDDSDSDDSEFYDNGWFLDKVFEYIDAAKIVIVSIFVYIYSTSKRI